MGDPSPSKLLLRTLLIFLLLCVGLLFFPSRRESGSSVRPRGTAGSLSQEMVGKLITLETKEKQISETVWAKELLAEQCGSVFEQLWDSLIVSTNRFSTLASFHAGEIITPNYMPSRAIAHGIELRALTPGGQNRTIEEWRNFLAERESQGWQIDATEFRHNRFETDDSGRPKRSYFYGAAHLTNNRHSERAVLEGNLIVDWAIEQSEDRMPIVKRVDASHLALKSRRGEPAFQPIMLEQVKPPEKSYFIDPLILYDLDGDGRSEIILAAKNLVFRRRDDGHFESEPLCRHSPGLIQTGLIADFDGDGVADFLCAKFDGLTLFKGSPRGTFDEPGRLVWSAVPHLKYATALTCGDIDGDGDLDVWLGQYKVPYTHGQMPTPYDDANDGFPAYLFLNDGHGNFSDATAAAGLEKKRWRRSYSASLADLDGDGDLDLIVVSDFAGVDLYANDGRGRFTDVTLKWLSEPHGFGMAHTLADFNQDGRLDFLMVGMNSPTADRLERLGLTRPDSALDQTMRSSMTYGNRLYLADSGKLFQQTPFSESIARSGWSWGCSAFDFDNDGFPDVYIANGHETQQSTREYDPEFWLHDIYVGNSEDDPVATAYFSGRFAATRGRGYSYGGHERNRLYLNQQGNSFLEIGHLMGVGLEQDSRNVVADDLDGDGRMDLLVTTFEVWPEVKQTLRVFKNTLDDAGNWIGFRLREQGGGTSPVGARITVRYPDGTQVRQIMTGDSYRSQHANTLHFGLGNIGQVDRVEIRWMNGRSLTLRQPRINQYHNVQPGEP
jgi:enediyne biosynthesis protein E4